MSAAVGDAAARDHAGAGGLQRRRRRPDRARRACRPGPCRYRSRSRCRPVRRAAPNPRRWSWMSRSSRVSRPARCGRRCPRRAVPCRDAPGPPGRRSGSIAAAVPITARAKPRSSPSRIRSGCEIRRRAAPAPGPRHRRAIDRTDSVVAALSERAVQVHHVDPAAPSLGESLRDRRGVLPINGLPRRLALAQANDAAVSNVDGGKEIHYGRYGAAWTSSRCAIASAGRAGGASSASRRSRCRSNSSRSFRATGAPLPSSTRRESLATPFTRNS